MMQSINEKRARRTHRQKTDHYDAFFPQGCAWWESYGDVEPPIRTSGEGVKLVTVLGLTHLQEVLFVRINDMAKRDCKNQYGHDHWYEWP